MWRIGFVIWAGWQMARWGVVGAAGLYGLYLWGGFNGGLVLAGLGVGLGMWALKRMLGNLYRRELTDRRWSR